ncbi:type II and III secretion system protein family protein [Pseudomethylobacillus aquaticus]|nr:type II and III secretion system protein family protein [Pseudomethylobacillus aquaticus]
MNTHNTNVQTLHPGSWMRTALLVTLLTAATLMAFDASANEKLDIDVGQQQIYQHGKSLRRVAVSDPAVASVTITSPGSLMITGKGLGSTEVKLWDDSKSAQPSHILQLNVQRPVNLEKEALETTTVDPLLDVAAAGKSVALTGSASSLDSHALALQALKQDPAATLNASKADFDSHVQIDIKVVEVSRKNVMRFGLFAGRNSGNRTLAVSAPGNLNSVSSTADGFSFQSASGFLPVLNAFNVALGNFGSGLLGTLSILESNGFAYTLAEPSLSAISGQTATFLAGGEFPVPIRRGAGSDSAITIQYKEYGVRLMLTPTVLDNERIYLKVSPEVSELDFANAVQTGGVSVPGLRVRRTDTSVSLGNGESFVISGMVSRNTINNLDKFPGLGSIPVIGAFFTSKRFDREDKELLMVVTPRLIRPIAADAKLPDLPGKAYHDYKPSFSDFFFSGSGIPEATTSGMSR